MVYKPEMDKRAQRPKEQAQQGKDIGRIAAGQEQSTKSIENLLGQQKEANQNLETGFTALMKSQKTSFIKRNLDNAFEIFTTRGEGKRAHKQRKEYQTEHLKDDKKHHTEFKTSDKKTDLDYEIQRHQEDTGEEQVTVLNKIAREVAGAEKTKKAIAERVYHRDKLGRFIAENTAFEMKRMNLGFKLFGKFQLKEADKLTGEIKKQEEHLAKMREDIESVGKSASESSLYRKEEIKLQKLERDRAKTTGSKEAEKTAKARIKEIKGQTVLSRMAKNIGKMAGFMASAGKAIKGKLPGMGTLLMMGVAGALLALMNSPVMEKLKKLILVDVIPAIGKWYDETLEPFLTKLWTFLKETTFPALWEGIKKLFTQIGDLVDNVVSMFTNIVEGNFWEATKDFGNILLDLVGMLDTAATTILKALGFDFEGSVGDAIGGFFDRIVKKIKEVFTRILDKGGDWFRKYIAGKKGEAASGSAGMVASDPHAMAAAAIKAGALGKSSLKGLGKVVASGLAGPNVLSAMSPEQRTALGTMSVGDQKSFIEKFKLFQMYKSMEFKGAGDKRELEALRQQLNTAITKQGTAASNIAVGGNTATSYSSSVVNAGALAMTNQGLVGKEILGSF